MARPGLTTVYATLTVPDCERIRLWLKSQSMNDWLRSVISDALEEAGELPLQEMPLVRQKHRRGAVPHGTLSRYGNKYNCRCDLCRKAMSDYQRQYRKRVA